MNFNSLLEATTYWNDKPIAMYSGGQIAFQHQDLTGTERLRTAWDGSVVARFTSLPFGDGFGPAGTDSDASHFGGLDQDSESGTDHATFRQYSPMQGRWMSPDPYGGSMNFGSPQSLNRYAYVGNMPLNYRDPSGLFGEDLAFAGTLKLSTSLCLKICEWAGPVGLVAAGVAGLFELSHVLGLWNHPTFHGATNARPPNKCGPGGANLKAPPGTDFVRNAQIVQTAAAAGFASGPGAYASVLAGYAAAVWPGVGPWDYKKGLPPGSLRDSYTDAGNYNYGVTCGALGLSAGACGNAAGQATKISNGGQLQGPGGYNSYPYGDQERDEQWVQKGYSDYASGNVCKVP